MRIFAFALVIVCTIIINPQQINDNRNNNNTMIRDSLINPDVLNYVTEEFEYSTGGWTDIQYGPVITSGSSPIPEILSIARKDNDLFLGGQWFSQIQVGPNNIRTTANNVGGYNIQTNTWYNLAGSGLFGGSGIIGADQFGQIFSVAASGNFVYFAGSHQNLSGSRFIRRYNFVEKRFPVIRDLGSFNGDITAMTFHGQYLYAGGKFTNVNGITVNGIVRIDPETLTYTPLGSGVSGTVNTIKIIGNDVYVGGKFTLAGGNPALNIAKWNIETQSWSSLGDGLGYFESNHQSSSQFLGVTSLAFANEELYAGGDFNKSGNNLTGWVAKFNFSSNSWKKLSLQASSYPPVIYAIEIVGDYLYAGGIIYDLAGTFSSKIVMRNLNTGTWSTMPGNSHNSVNAILATENGLYVTGKKSLGQNLLQKWTIPIPDVPLLSSPQNNQNGLTIPINLAWGEARFAERYYLQVSTDQGFSNLVVNENNLPLPNKQITGLNPNTSYFWRVKSRNLSGESAWSQVSQFKTLGQPLSVQLISPQNTSTVNIPVKAVWRKPAELLETVLGYRIQVSTTPNFSSIVYENLNVTDTSETIGNLNFNTDYFWRVSAKNEFNFGEWSNTWQFRTEQDKPSTPAIISPADFSQNLINPINLRWSSSLRASSYQIEISEDLFVNIIYSNTKIGINSTTETVSNLQPGKTYYWRVRALNSGGSSEYSIARFSTLPVPNTVNLHSPVNNQINTEFASLTLRWFRVPTVAGYQPFYSLHVSKDSTFNNLVSSFSLNDSTMNITGLEPFTRYYWRVRATNIAGQGQWSSIRTFVTKNAAPEVVSLSLPSNNSKGINRNLTFKWNKSKRAETYRLQVSNLPGFNGLVKVDTVLGDTLINISDLDLYTNYFWRVKAINQIGESNWSEVFSFKTKGVALAPNLISPSNNTVNQNPQVVQFIWNKAGEQIEAIQNYRLQISTSPLFENDSLFVNLVTTDTTRTVNLFISQKTYYWRVSAANENGTGDWSAVFRFRTAPVSVPGITYLIEPENNAIGVAKPVTFKWRTNSLADFYSFIIASDSSFSNIVYSKIDIPDTFITVNNLQGMTKYYWKVSAYNSLGGNTFSSVFNFMITGTPFAAGLIEPVNNVFNQAVNCLTFKWSEPGVRTENILSYQLQVSWDALFNAVSFDVTSIADTFYVLDGLTMNTRYYWRVRAINNSGSGDWSAVNTFMTGLFAPAQPVLSLPLNNTDAIWRPVNFAWAKVDAASHYRIQLSINDSLFRDIYPNELEFDVSNIFDTVYTRTFLTRNGTQYFWRVKAFNSQGESEWSQVFNFKSAGPPKSVNLITPGVNQIDVPLYNVPFSWSFPGHVLPDLLTYYFIEFYTHPDLGSFNRVYIAYPNTTPEDTTRLVGNISNTFSPGTSYWWRVESYNNAGTGIFSEVRKFTTVFTAIPSVPQLVSPANNQIAVYNPNQFKFRKASQAAQYFAQVATDSLFTQITHSEIYSSLDTSFIVSNLEPYVTYFWRVKSLNQLGESEWSETRKFKTYGLPYATNPVTPANNALNQPINGLKFVWSKAQERIESIFNYRLQIATDSNFINIFLDDLSLTDTSRIVNGLSPNTKYFWRTNARNQVGWGEWSPAFTLETIKNITVLYPNGGELIPESKNLVINWIGSPYPVKIEYSTNSGSDWVTLVSNYTSVESKYNWSVPELRSNSSKIRVSYVEQGISSDESDNNFSIVDFRPELVAAGQLFSPQIGRPFYGYRFSINYKSQENKPPAQGFPRAELFLNDTLVSVVSLTGTVHGNNDFITGKEYFQSATLHKLGNYKLRFLAVDIDGDTSIVYPSPGNLINGPIVVNTPDDLEARSPINFFNVQNPNSIGIGELFNASISVRNNSIYQVVADVQVSIINSNGVPLESTIIRAVISGNSTWTNYPAFTILEEGVYIIKANVDPQNLIIESNEDNNIVTRTFTVGNPSNSITMSNQSSNTAGTNFNPVTVSGQSGYNLGGASQNSNSLGVSGGTVKVTLNGIEYSGRTESNGSYSVPITGLPAGTYNAVTEVSDGQLVSTSNSILEISEYQPPAGSQNDIRDISVNSILQVNPVILTGREESAIISLRNNGNVTLNNVKLLLRLNGLISDSLIISSIQPAASQNVVMRFTPTIPGRAVLVAEADPNFEIDEISKNNNLALKEIVMTASLSDLTVSSFIVPEILKVNSDFVMNATITNQGNNDVTAPFTAGFYIDEELVGTRTINGIKINQNISIQLPVSVSDSGQKFFKVVADITNSINEEIENNNESGVFQFVNPVIQNLTLRQQDFTVTPVLPGAGDSVYFTITVLNSGDKASLPTSARFSVANSTYNSIVDVPALQPGGAVQISTAVPYIATGRGTFTGRAEVNFDNNQPELTRLDNNAFQSFVSGEGSDLAIDSTNHIMLSNPYSKPNNLIFVKSKVTNKHNTNASGTVEYSIINSNGQREILGSVQVNVPAGQQVETDSLLISFPVTPVELNATLKSIQPPDFNSINNRNNLITGDVAPVIILPDTITFYEDSSIVFNLANYVIDPGDDVENIGWNISQSNNLIYEYIDTLRLFKISAPENYYGREQVRFDATDYNFTSSKFVIIDVEQVIDYPEMPSLISPVNGEKGLLNPVNLVWLSGINTAVYRLQVAPDSLFGAGMIKDTLVTDTTIALNDLPLFTQIFWRVRGENDEAEGQWSNVNRFTTLGNPYASVLLEPVNNSINQPLDSLNFRWNKAEERIETIQFYQFQLSLDSSFNSLDINDSTLTDTLFIANNLEYLTNYFWRIRASNETGWGDWSQVNKFTTIIERPLTPVLLTPVNNGTGVINPVFAIWSSALRSEKYKIQLSDSASFSNLILDDGNVLDTAVQFPNLNSYTQYFWRVKATNAGGESDWSNVYDFRTLGLPFSTSQVFPANNSFNQPIDSLNFTWRVAGEQNDKPLVKDAVKLSLDDQEGEFNNGVVDFITGKESDFPETILSYNLLVVTDTVNMSVFYNDTTLTDTTIILSGFNNLTEYYWKIRGKNENGWGEYSNWYKFTTIISAPDAPVLISPANNGTGVKNPVAAVWKAAQRAENYRIQLADNPGFVNPVLDEINVIDTLKQLPVLSNYTQYYWRVKAINIGGESDWSAAYSFRTLGLPFSTNQIIPSNNSQNQPVDGLSFIWSVAGEQNDLPGNKKIKVQNLHSEDLENGKNINSKEDKLKIANSPVSILNYEILIVTDTLSMNIFYNDSTLSDTTITLSGFANLTEYYWKVRAKNENGWGEYSNWYKFTTIIAAPDVPVLISPVNNGTGVTNPVTAVWNSANRAVNYRIQLADNPGFVNPVIDEGNVIDTIKQLTSLNNLTQYYWRVKAVNIGGESDWSASFAFRTLGTPSLVQLLLPEYNAINQPVNNMQFVWTKAFDITETILNYRFELSLDTMGINFVIIDSTLMDTFKVVNNLNNLTNYYWRISSKNEAGWSNYSNWNKFATIISVPSQVILLSPQNNSVNQVLTPLLVWSKENISERYKIQLSSDANFVNIIFSDSTVTDTFKVTPVTLNYKTKYYWRVQAINVGGTGNFSTTWNFTTQKQPIASPSNLIATALVVGEVKLTWRDNSINENGFLIYRKTGDSLSVSPLLVIDTVAADETQYFDYGISDTTLYSYQVIAFNGDTVSSPSNFAFVTTLTGIKEISEGQVPEEYSLSQNYPNPFNPSTIIRFAVPYDSFVDLSLFNIQGEKIKALFEGNVNPGFYQIKPDFGNLPSGIYLYRIVARSSTGESFIETKKLTLVK
ncbi:MAG: hypothetical protein IAE91_09750 [Ignavibacteriaceae bacterium]|nr:hypothetical protein [Ignavibacteriaceae bacterium]